MEYAYPKYVIFNQNLKILIKNGMKLTQSMNGNALEQRKLKKFKVM